MQHRTYYSQHQFTQVENGGVEELLVFEPELGNMPDFENATWTEIFDDREERKRAQFES